MPVVRSSSNKGSFTIEALLVLSTLLVILFLLCFSFMLMYQRVLLIKTASVLAQQVGKEGKLAESLSEVKTQTLEKETLAQLLPMIKPERIKGEVRYKRGPVTQEISVMLCREVMVPLGQLKKFFTGKNTVTLVAEEKVIILAPAAFIRNADLFVECADRIGDQVNFGELFAKIKG